MRYVKVEPHPVKRLLSEDEKAVALQVLDVAFRRDARLVSFCADCEQPVAVDKLNRFRHLQAS